MTRGGLAVTRNERALSEVVGFVLILGIITAAFSLYLVYGVPAQGRENEILHMNDVKDQFVTYKLSLDSLFNNNKVGTSVSNSFNLGTSGGYTQGSNSIIPILSPVSSSGVIAINQRTPTPETLDISSYSMVVDPNVHNTSILTVGSSTTVNTVPQHVYINISVSQNLASPTYYGLQIDGTGWTATVNLSPRMTPSNISTIITQTTTASSPSCSYGQLTGTSESSGSGPHTVTAYCLVTTPGTLYNGTDVTISVFKNGETTLQSIPVYRSITSGSYPVDIMDPAYGIQPILQIPDNLTLLNTLPNSSTAIQGSGLIVNSYTEKDHTISPISLGSLEYRAKNNYWIPQTYYYQTGGVFLEQSDGNITWKLPPEISFSNDPSHNLVTVNINALTLDNSSSGMVGGNSPVQVKTTLDSITPLPFATVAQGTGNTKWIRIAVNTTDDKAREMWRNYFNYTAMAAGIPNTQVGTGSTESYIVINGPDADPNGAFDINVIASNATYVPSVHGVGGILQ